MEKIKIYSKSTSPVGVKVSDIHFSREWPRKDSVVSVTSEQLEELLNDVGFRYMIETGILYIDDMAVKQDFGLEPEDAKEPVNIIVLSDNDCKRYLTVLPYNEFCEKVKVLSYEQMQNLADYAIHNELIDLKKADFIKKICGKDIVKAIQLNQADREEIPEEETHDSLPKRI